ncbi:MAG: DUF6122 family protein [Bacteroidetes bacterium]|nr:DUF6122 family protein [Bacteroidota bacterium]MDA0873703.1 DUF6122 family protein [Bacteroidota bacterium]
MLHILLHFAVPLVVAIAFFHKNWKSAFAFMVATMLVDLDHLLATPIYDPTRCSIGFHPLHTWPFILVYVGLFLAPWAWKPAPARQKLVRTLHHVGVGLLIHMGLDALDCLG